MKKAVLHSYSLHGKNNCLGSIVRKEGQPDSINYLTMDQVIDQAVQVGSAVIHEKLAYQPEG